MEPGRLDKRITISQSVAGSPAQNTYGEPQTDWEELATVWAAVEPVQGQEFWAQQQVQSKVTIRVRIRYLSTVTAGMKITYGSRALFIESVIDPKEKHTEMQLMCSEGVRDD